MTEKARTGGRPRRGPEYLRKKSISIAKASKRVHCSIYLLYQHQGHLDMCIQAQTDWRLEVFSLYLSVCRLLS